MSQATEMLKDEADWVAGEDGFCSASIIDLTPIFIPDPPPVTHTYLTCSIITIDLIPTNEEDEAKDVAVGSVINLLEPTQAQITYRHSVKAFLSRVVQRTLGAKVYETGLHALNWFVPDDPVRLTVLLGRTNNFLETWLPTLTEKLSTLSDVTSDSGRAFMAEMMQVVEDDCTLVEDVQPLTEHTVSHVQATASNTSRQLKVLADIEDTNVVIDANNLHNVRFLAFIEEVAVLVGKNELFKRSVILIRGWWAYETVTSGGWTASTLLSDQALCVLIVSIFNQHHATLFQPLQVLSIFLAEYCEVEWSKCIITVQGIIPFRVVAPKSEIESQTSMETETTTEIVLPITPPPAVEILEPWTKYPTDSDLLNAAFLLKYADTVKYVRPTPAWNKSQSNAALASTAVTIPAAGTSGLPISPPLSLLLPHLSPMSPGKDLDMSNLTATTQMESIDGSNTTGNTLLKTYSSDLITLGSTKSNPETTDDQENATRRSSGVADDISVFEKSFINIINPLNLSNMAEATMTYEKAVIIAQIFETGARNLSQALKLSQGEHINVHAPFNRFFKSVLLRFRGSWRPDVFKGAQSMCQYAGGESNH